ncbi:T9SS type A sorting domain-containing protein [Winogradskyella sediminis]|uniref:Por secretion system C-terminal sorting domain-containing protein n=1 Tax=Winogradskyella sediminis TaxID=1382466 RepID=A0A1H1SX17_9FLAO|nr:T9SS type A sorting domain-containing protein [Winogradskyella sediminis]SDS52530.1 hypothetical protein SAMN04489797_1790 [Winogradskyella sediminis]
MKKSLYIILACFAFIVTSYGQGSESFTNHTLTAGSYENGSYTGDNGVVWTYIRCRKDEGFQITGKSLMLRRASDNSKITSSTVPGGIGNFTCKLRKAFTGGGNRQAELFVNGVSQGSSMAWDNTDIQTFTVNNINITGDVVVEIRNISTRQFVIDDIEWTGYTLSPSIAIDPSAITNLDYMETMGPSIEQNIDIEGILLTSNITITASTNFQVSLTSGSGFANTVTIPSSSANGTTTIYTRLIAGLPTNTYNGTIGIASTGVTTQNVTVSGEVIAFSNNCGSESFTNHTLTGTSYENGSYTGDNGIDWTYVRCRKDEGYQITGKGLMLRNASDGSKITSATVPDGIGSFTCKLLKAFSGSGNRQAELFVNGVSQGTSVAWDNSTIQTFTVDNINIQGDVVLEIRNISGRQFVIDDLEWTCYSACTPPADPSGTIAGATPVCAANTTLSFSGSAPTDVAYYWQTSSLGEDQTNNAASNLTVTTSGDYYVRAYNTVEGCWSDGEVGPYAVSATTSAPIIDTHPSNSSSSLGTTASFVVSSPNASSYQWQVSTNGGTTWSNTGTNSNALAVANVQLADDGNLYQVIITNACGSTNSNSASLTVTTTTTFNSGDLIFVGFDGQINGSGSNDEFLIATLVDITSGTEFSLVNSRFEAGAAANVRTNKWGGGSDDPSEAPFEAKITYTGASIIPAGAIIRLNVTTSNTFIVFATVTEGTTTTTRTSDFSATVTSPGDYANISTSGSDQLYVMQGDFVFDGTDTPNEANYTFNGTLLHGITIDTPWVPLTDACSGSSSGRESRLPPELRCFNVESQFSIRGFYENDKEHGLATIRQIINSVSDVSSNWTMGAYNWDPTSSAANRAGKSFLISPGNPAGQWVGDVDNNWFNCANWEGLSIPKATTNVNIDNSATNPAVIDHTALYSDDFGDVAQAKDVVISGNKIDISGHTNNILEVHGNLTINGTGILDMDDGNTATDDGQLFISGNWNNEIGKAYFEEGNGTVIFNGTSPQIMYYGAPPIPPGPFENETFYNVILDNDFNISETQRTFYMDGDLTLINGSSLTIQSNQFVHVGNKLDTDNGSMTLEDSASLIQVNDVNNVGYLTAKRNYNVDSSYDYIYWSSPITEFNTNLLPVNNNHVYTWDPIAPNSGSGNGQGNWVSANGQIMQAGIGYIARSTGVSSTLVFQNGVPHNGTINLNLARGNDNDGLNGDDDQDDWNLIGNPYPSAISAMAFLDESTNPNIDGFINLWTHGLQPLNTEPNPFYDSNFVYNYDEDDYITANGTGTTCSPNDAINCFDGYIASGQGFFVNAKDGAPATNLTVTFTNSMRQIDYDNSNFYRPAHNENSTSTVIEKHRIWLDLGSENNGVDRLVIGYVTNATMERDRLYDAICSDKSGLQNFYSIIDAKPFVIQGRSLPFSDSDRVPLGFVSIAQDNYTIAINAVDGLFQNQAIYLNDKHLNRTHNLIDNPYTFTSDAGEFNDRFEIVYTTTVLSTDDYSSTANDLTLVELANNKLQFKIKKNLTITKVEILDMLGRSIYNFQGHNSIETYNVPLLSKAPYIARVTLSNGQVINKKAIKK